MTIKKVRTTAFRLGEDDFGRVFIYRMGTRFAQAWSGLKAAWKDRGDRSSGGYLPYGGLAVSLRVLSGDFVALERFARDRQAFIVSRKFIDRPELRSAVGAWEARALGLHDGPISRVLDDLEVEEARVADFITRYPGLCPQFEEGWAWDAGVWEAAHQLAALPMETDAGPISWRLDSEASLLCWDNLLVAKSGARAMHKPTGRAFMPTACVTSAGWIRIFRSRHCRSTRSPRG